MDFLCFQKPQARENGHKQILQDRTVDHWNNGTYSPSLQTFSTRRTTSTRVFVERHAGPPQSGGKHKQIWVQQRQDRLTNSRYTRHSSFQPLVCLSTLSRTERFQNVRRSRMRLCRSDVDNFPLREYHGGLLVVSMCPHRPNSCQHERYLHYSNLFRLLCATL